ncbi:bifunctional DNA-formamidopyrimidine glycosylase/DNA-(apurinic or apyrimidinic site) lyase [Actinocrinis puniceicyclus]|uniref:Formamidopyrimidine-DNA glycosylase n=1 Tax=Actinocrinis puniceicyclus TaxID=977794 RepID=A0A8J7WGH0_9ACTN|nr:bifunctional DNA-formamidopyrimidine glycosylase/DNA-(apurinic or apyrimidinic site) lyase [Actinocrinis puniceicyclus]MBS2961691.1 bifunctional DNA-formamidopyrimidine glycosylase/DNA-(apurinic or apyrimidinic site) lyase [Actinocrinis puniceicyclus]
MPELPEVEVVRRGLEHWTAGRTVAAAHALHPRALRRHAAGPADFAARLAGRTFGTARRRGKYLWVPLFGPGQQWRDGDDFAEEALLGHLGMSGQLLVQPAAAPDEKHLRVRVVFADDGPQLRFVDQRTFGGLCLDLLKDGVPASVAHIARDPMDPLFDDAKFVAALRVKSTGVKRALLDQSLISGVGNIYADEALWRAKLHFERPGSTLRPAEAARLLAAVREVLAEALAVGGTSFDSLYVNVNGESGYFSRSLNAYGQAGRPCGRCQTPIARVAFMNRSSYYCPRCQRAQMKKASA